MTMFRNGRSRRSVARTTAALLTALVAALLLAVGQAAAVPGTQTWTGQAAGATPDIERGGLTLFNTSGAAFITNASAGTLNFTVNGTIAYVGYCTDTTEMFSTGTEAVEVTTQAPPATAATRAASWIILNRAVTGAPTAAKQQQAAINQVAIWLLLDGNINKTTPTSDAALNAAAAALVAEAQAATATPSTLTVTAATPAAGATSTTVTITGKPGAVVSLSASGGTLSAPSVTLGANGTATVTLSVAGPGTATVSASAAGDGNYIAIEPTGPQPQPQATATATSSTLTASVGATFTAQGTQPSGPITPIAGGATARLVITKKAPARALVLSQVKYTIVVRNPSKVAARSVVLRDVIPSGLSLVTASRARTLSNGVITFQLGTLAPGAKRTVTVTLLADASVRGKRTNVATVSATGVRAVRATAATVFRTLARRVQPAVTG